MSILRLCTFSRCFGARASILSIAILLAIWLGSAAPARAVLFLADAGVLDVTNFGAKGDGVADDTAAIQSAIDGLPPFDVKHPFQTKAVYFPNGTYLITNTIERKDSAGRYQPGLILIGQSQTNVVIKLANHSPAFQNPSAPKPMVLTASGLLGRDPQAGGKDPNRGEGNDAYFNTIENLTLEIGSGNSGAIGLDYLANNIGSVRDVTIRAVERAHTGLSMTRKWIGPALIQRVTIAGFNIGIDIGYTQYSVTLDDVTIRKSRQFGLRNSSNSVPFHNLVIETEAGVGVANLDPRALISGIKGTISGRGHVAFQNVGSANLKDVVTAGFVAEGEPANSTYLDGVFDGATRLGNAEWTLPVRSQLVSDEVASDAWVNVQSFGAVADPRIDSTSAINAAFRSGGKTIFFPNGQYKVSGSIVVPETVEKIEGMFSTVFADQGTQHGTKGPYAVFSTAGIRTIPLVLRRLVVEGRGGSFAILEHRASSPALLQDIVAAAVGLLSRPAEGGSVFLENISCSGRSKLAGPAGVWFRQFNLEAGHTAIESDGTPVWMLGVKTEQTPTLISAKNRSSVEVVGGLVYRVKAKATNIPFMILQDSRVVASYAEEAFFPTAVYSTHLISIVDGVESAVRAEDLPLRGKFGRMARQISVKGD